MAVFSDTTNKNGLIQTYEYWTRRKDGAVSGDADLLKIVTARINRGFEKVMPLLLSYTDKMRWDDPNHADAPRGKIDIVSGQHDYTVAEDDNSLDILNLLEVRILESSSATEYQKLTRLTLDDDLAFNAMSPNPSETGVPTHWLERGNTLFLYPKPNYAATNGIKLFFEREQSYFVSTDTTKEPGIPKHFHELPVLHAAIEDIRIYRSDERSLIQDLKEEILRQEGQIMDMISKRNPTSGGLRPLVEDCR